MRTSVCLEVARGGQQRGPVGSGVKSQVSHLRRSAAVTFATLGESDAIQATQYCPGWRSGVLSFQIKGTFMCTIKRMG